MKIHVYPIVSSLHEEAIIETNSNQMIQELEQILQIPIHYTDLLHLYEADLSFILVQSGGSEGAFLSILSKLKEPIYLLTYGTNNSLAASMEILSYLRDQHLKAEILHGPIPYLVDRIQTLMKPKKAKSIVNLGVIGEPSDWLIASKVDYQKCLDRFGIQLKDIPLSEVITSSSKQEKMSLPSHFDYNPVELTKAFTIHHRLEEVVQKHQLKGFTIRCFDLLNTVDTTGCLGLSLLNQSGIIGSCEGDIPAMLSMYLLFQATNQIGFQANPAWIDTFLNQIKFAHCTIPLNMVEDYHLRTHFESGKGVAISGLMKHEKVTIFKLSRNLEDFYLEEGFIISTPREENLCRTQVVIQLPEVSYFLEKPYGNHHIIIYGHHKEKIINYMNQF